MPSSPPSQPMLRSSLVPTLSLHFETSAHTIPSDTAEVVVGTETYADADPGCTEMETGTQAHSHAGPGCRVEETERQPCSGAGLECKVLGTESQTCLGAGWSCFCCLGWT